MPQQAGCTTSVSKPFFASTERDAAPGPAIATDDEPLAREQHVRCTDDPVDRRLPGAVAVVEEVLRPRLVDRDHGEGERAVCLHRLEANHAGGRLLHAGDDVAELLAAGAVQHADHVCAVIHRQLRLVIDRSLDVQVSRLRKLIELDATSPRFIQTVWGVGYVFVPDGSN